MFVFLCVCVCAFVCWKMYKLGLFLPQLIKNYAELDVGIFVAALRPRLRVMFANSGVYTLLPEANFFMSVHDAVLVALAEMKSTTESLAKAGPNDDGEDDIDGAAPGARRESRSYRRRRPTVEEVRSILETDPDATTDLSVIGEERDELS